MKRWEPNSIYSEEDIARGLQWYKEHKVHVDSLLSYYNKQAMNKPFPMSGSDIGKPELWKSGAWKWFLIRYSNRM